MKKPIGLILIVAVLTFAPVAALAQNDDSATDDVQTTNTTDSASDDSDLRARLQQRLDNRRAEIAAKLDAQRKQLLSRKCQAAQTILDAILMRARVLYDNRVSLYEGLIERVDALVSRLELNHTDVDLTELKAELDNLKTMVEDFLSDFETYILALSSTVGAENCTDDPKSFHEYLETARELRAELLKNTRQIKALLSGDFKAALTNLRSQLSDTTSDGTT